MTDNIVTLRLIANADGVVTGVKLASGEVGKLGSAGRQAGAQASAGINAIGTEAERARKKVGLLSGTLGQIKGLLAGYVGLQGIKELGRTADGYSDIIGKLKQVTDGERELAQAKAATFRISQDTYQSLDATTTLYARSAAALAQYGVGQAKIAELTETVNRGLLISRATAQESASAILQLSQAMGAGALRGEEFNAVNEAAPRLMQLLAESIGRPRGELKKLAEDGKLTIDVLLKAFTGANAAALATEAAEVPLTIGRAWQTAKNELVRYIGEADQASGTSSQIASAIKSIGENVDLVVGSLVALGKIAVTVYTIQLLQSGRAWIANLIAQHTAVVSLTTAQAAWGATTAASFGAAMKSMGALGIALNVLGSALVGWQIGSYLRDQFLEVRLAGIALVNGMLKGWEYIKQGALISWEAIKAGFLGALNMMRNGLADLVGFHAKLANLIPDFMGGSAVADGLHKLEGKLRSSESAADGFKAAVARINEEANANRQQIDQVTGEMADYEIAQQAAKEATEGGTSAAAAQELVLGGLANKAGKTADELKRLAEAQREFERETARRKAALDGPQAVAKFQRDDELRLAREAKAKGEATVAAVKEREQLIRDEYAKTDREIRKGLDAPQALLDAMTGELQLLRMIGPEREIERRRLQAVADMQRELADASEAAGDAVAREVQAVRLGYSSWRDYEAAMLAAASANAVLSVRIEEQAAMAQDWARTWMDAVADVADAFTRFAMSGLRDFKGLAKDLKSIAKQLVGDLIRTFLQQKIVIPIQAQLTQVFSGGMGQSGGFLDVLRTGFDGLLSGITKIFSRGGSAAQAMQTATEAGWQMAKAAGVAVVPVGGVGGMMLPGGQLLGGGSAFSGLAGMLGPLLGVGMGASMGGDTAGKIGGGLAGGALAMSLLGAGGGLAGLSAGMAAGGLFGGVSGMLGAMGPVGWAALAAFAVNKISGGKLFGTSYKTESASQQWSVSEAGASGSQSVTEVKQQSFFRGRKWRTTTSALDAEAMAAVNELFLTLEKTVQTAAQQLGIDVPDIVGGSFKREFDKNGNLTREFGTIAGRVYNEAQDAFAARLVGENMLAVAKAAGSAAELEQLANAYRGTGEQLQAFATLALAVQEDLRNANGIWQQVDGDGVMTRIVGYVEELAKAGESLADAYTRIQQTITQYGDLIGGVRQQIATRGLNQYQKAQLEVELAYREQVKQANELAKALGLSGARAEDLASIEQLRALNMADLAMQYAAQQRAQNQQWLADLGMSDLSPLRDSQKLANGMDLLRRAVGAGDAQRAQKLAEQVLGLGRNMYASGADYNALYEQVTALVGDLDATSMEELQGLTNEQLANLADLVSGLPQQIAQELAELLVAPPPTTTDPQLPPAPAPAPPPPSGGGGGGSDEIDSCVAVFMRMPDATLAGELQAGDVHHCLDPIEGATEQPARWVGAAVRRLCVRLVTGSGAALTCSTTTPFTHVDAPADLPEYSSFAPDMLGREVIVLRRGIRFIEPVVDVQDAGMQWVVPADFGGRSFAAGESVDDGLIYSHNMQKTGSNTTGYLAAMAASLASIESSNSVMASAEQSRALTAMSESTRTGR